jgi:hypothetical protein
MQMSLAKGMSVQTQNVVSDRHSHFLEIKGHVLLGGISRLKRVVALKIESVSRLMTGLVIVRRSIRHNKPRIMRISLLHLSQKCHQAIKDRPFGKRKNVAFEKTLPCKNPADFAINSTVRS